MNKSYYFSHDYTASEDVKILYLRQELGMEGYGIYWFIVERLAVAGGRLQLKEQQLERAAGGIYEFISTPDEFFLIYDKIVNYD